jgi:hypothetical protein
LFPRLTNVKFEKNRCADFPEKFGIKDKQVELYPLLTKCYPPMAEMYQCYSTCQAYSDNQL